MQNRSSRSSKKRSKNGGTNHDQSKSGSGGKNCNIDFCRTERSVDLCTVEDGQQVMVTDIFRLHSLAESS